MSFQYSLQPFQSFLSSSISFLLFFHFFLLHFSPLPTSIFTYILPTPEKSKPLDQGFQSEFPCAVLCGIVQNCAELGSNCAELHGLQSCAQVKSACAENLTLNPILFTQLQSTGLFIKDETLMATIHFQVWQIKAIYIYIRKLSLNRLINDLINIMRRIKLHEAWNKNKKE